MTTAVIPERAVGRRLGDVRVVSAKLACSVRTVYRLVDAGRMPAPRRIASLLRWDLEEIDRWIADGCRPVRVVKNEPTPTVAAAGAVKMKASLPQ